MGKSVFITQCNTPQGGALAEYFLQQGWYVLAGNTRPAETLSLRSSEHLLPIDLPQGDPDMADRAMEKAVEAFGSLDVLLCNDNHLAYGFLEEVGDRELMQFWEVSVHRVIQFIQTASRQMRKQNRGMILNMISSAGLMGSHMYALYGAAHAAIKALSESLASDLSPFGVDVKLVVTGDYGSEALGDAELLHGKESDSLSVYRQRFRSFQQQRNLQAQAIRDDASHLLHLIQSVYRCVTEPTPFLNPIGGEAHKHLQLSRCHSDDALLQMHRHASMPNYSNRRRQVWWE